MLRTWNMNHSAGHLVNIQLMGPLAYRMAMVDHYYGKEVEAKHQMEADKAFWQHQMEAAHELYAHNEQMFNQMGGMQAMMKMMQERHEGMAGGGMAGNGMAGNGTSAGQPPMQQPRRG